MFSFTTVRKKYIGSLMYFTAFIQRLFHNDLFISSVLAVWVFQRRMAITLHEHLASGEQINSLQLQ